MRIAILTISDAGHRGERADTSGDAIAAWAADRAYTLADARAWCPTRPAAIAVGAVPPGPTPTRRT